MASPVPLPRFGVVVPVKAVRAAKSRLAPLGDEVRRALVEAFALDTVTAALECRSVGRVLVVTDDVRLAAAVREAGADAVPEGESGLNASLVQGAAELLRRDPNLVPVALCADLPCLRADQLERVLAATPREAMGFLPDAEGTGTTLVAAPTLTAFAPRFGPGSRAAHERHGAVEIAVPDVATVRRDVDTPADLHAALSLGVGPRTAWVVTRHRLHEVPART